ncbi:DEKNAAC103878 [Brettanomyces naardenensis]|uniref:DEKNAAC103878 n=1 Tax=Brettanomyces naardenensis TaxID=13370 RepID=A0A448YPI2_BRENA|nr:DEKNAAC103878 [Brettanomyces naardenensis]
MQNSNYPPPYPFRQGAPVYPGTPPPGGILGPPVTLAVLTWPNPQGLIPAGPGTSTYQLEPPGKYLPQTVGYQSPLVLYSMDPPRRVYGPSSSYFIPPYRIPRNGNVGAIPYQNWNHNEFHLPLPPPPQLPGSAYYPDVDGAQNLEAKAKLSHKRKKIQGLGASSIAEIGYGLSPVHKRPKCSVLKSEKATRRSQGRPFASSITGRFVLHDNLDSIVRDLIGRKKCKLLCYNFTEAVNSPRGLPIAPVSPKLASSTSTQRRKVGPFEFEQINLDLFVSEDPVISFDTYFGSKHSEIKLIDCSEGVKSPSQSTIRHNPLLEANATVGNSEPDSRKVERLGINKSENGSHFPPSNGEWATPSYQRNTINMNFHPCIVEAFGIEKYQFIKTIRDSNGHILKLETIRPPRNTNNEIEYTAGWLKRSTCYPRYKAGIKIQLVSDEQSFILYNSWKMILWDIKQKKGGEEIKNSLNSSTREVLFGGRMVYVKI